jgi:hypothetical protein
MHLKKIPVPKMLSKAKKNKLKKLQLKPLNRKMEMLKLNKID